MSAVFDLDLESNIKFVLLCLADCADEFGECYPGVAQISRKTSMSERSVQRCLADLSKQGIIHSYWDYPDPLRTKKVRKFRLNIADIPQAPRPNLANCPAALRKETIERFACTCTYCHAAGDIDKGPDGKPWHIDRIIPGARGGSYVAANVTLACATCNIRKGAKLAPQGTISTGAKLAPEGCQVDTTVVPTGHLDGATPGTLSIIDPSVEPSVNRERAPKRPSTATRLPADFKLTPERRAVAEAEKADPDREFQNFTDYWLSASGEKARKHDWDATWRIWCRRAPDFKPRPRFATGHPEDTGWRPPEARR